MPDNSGFWVGPLDTPDTYELVTELGSGGEGRVWMAVLPLRVGAPSRRRQNHARTCRR